MIDSLYKPFKKWAAKGTVWLVSDTHFLDPDREAMGYTITSQEQYAILKRKCHKNDTLIHLGDVGNPIYLRDIPSRKILITGNHDHGALYYSDYFNDVFSGPVFIAQKILLSHEPIKLPFCINIHGHDHSGSYHGENCINLCPNIVGYEPISLGRIINLGCLSEVEGIHAYTIAEQKRKKDEEANGDNIIWL